MEYLQLTEYQAAILFKNAGGKKYVVNVPQEGDDEILVETFTTHARETEALVNEGLMEELCTEDDPFIQKMKEQHGRNYRMFMLTDLARHMFSPVWVKGSKDGTFRNAAKTVH